MVPRILDVRVRYGLGLLIPFLTAFLLWQFLGKSGLLIAPADKYSDHLQIHDDGYRLFTRDDDHTCSNNKTCSNGACCGESGYCGYGPTYCGKGCKSNCDAKAQCGKYAAEGDETCPLNVCCGEFGYCGTTSEFCGANCQNNCGQPSVPDGKSSHSVRDKVIVYYEAWSSYRKCNKFQPWNIPIDGVTHINFAFAYIDPDSYEITTMDSQTPEDLFQQVTALKSMKSGLGVGLEVWISIGGWTFSNNGTDTQAVFGDIARSADNRQKFADNLVQFMTRYGFDGADLDWEYPGAGDRGGKKEDTENFVQLIRTLKTTFENSPRGGYGLTFTIPSSYWYLRWFDVPKMLDAGASWVNLMSYDLHGVWDQNNPIGSYVHAHTNLTEIKDSMSLLWRNDVAPEKVVLGTGFYGRSFQLNDTSCDTSGCPFAGAANKGECTGEGGILGYFEIQQILKDNPDIEPVHDEESAVNYFKFHDDQWVSYDNATTFDQKFEWADSIGLGGLMAWAIDLDDEKFTALSGLIGRDAGTGLNKTLVKRDAESASWSSDNGQDCYTTKCGEECPIDQTILERYPSNCGNHEHKSICCPRDRTPRDCFWRGGEKGGIGRACHGQCHNDELTILLDGYGNRHCATGNQAFCCTADRYADLLDGCHLGSCGGSCDDGTTEVAKQYDFGSCWNHAIHGYKRPWCCKQDLKNCHWVGKGSCDDNNCANDDIQLSLSGYGDSSTLCGVAGRKKSLCCNPPEDIDLFTPVPLNYLFPDPPPVTDPVKWDLQLLGGYTSTTYETVPKNPTADPATSAFGFVLISGPKDVVSSFSKRDNSDIEVVDCPSITSDERQTTRVVCTNDGEDSNCDEIFHGGLEGTVVRMPDNCGPGSYVVAHSLRRSGDQTLPTHLGTRAAPGREVMDFEFSYDFGLVKRSDDKVQLRVDYSNIPGYWDEIVNEPGEKRKRSVVPHELSQRDLLDKRFFSSDSKSWGDKFDDLDAAGYYTNLSEPASEVIIDDKLQCDEDSYLRVQSGGTCLTKSKFGFTFIGTLQPFSLEQAYGFVDFMFDLDATVQVTGSATVDTDYKTRSSHIIPNSDIVFSHPGIVSFKPTFDVEIGIEAQNVSFSGDFTAHLRTQTDHSINNGYTRVTFPHGAGGTKGAVKAYTVDKSFVGHMYTEQGEIELTLNPMFTMDIAFNQQTSTSLSKRQRNNLQSWGSVSLIDYRLNLYAPNKLAWNTRGVDLKIDSQFFSLLDVGNGKIKQWASLETPGDRIGKQPGAVTLHTQQKGESKSIPDYDYAPWPYVIFPNDIVSCPIKAGTGSPSCSADLCADGIIDCDDEPASDKRGALDHTRRHVSARSINESFLISSDTSLKKPLPIHLRKRDPTGATGSSRPFPRGQCLDDTGAKRGFQYNSLSYPVISDWTVDESRYDNVYDAMFVLDCSEGRIGTHSIPNLRYYVTEHIIELQTMSLFSINVAANTLPGGESRQGAQIHCDFMRSLQSNVLTNPPLTHGSITNSNKPIERIMQVHGWEENWKPFVFLERGINACKARLWKISQPVDPLMRALINSNRESFGDALVNIRTVINVFSYLNDPDVHDKWVQVSNAIRAELDGADTAWVNNGNQATHIALYWDDWIRKHMTVMARHGRAFAQLCLSEMQIFWAGQPNDDLKVEVLAALATLQGNMGLITVNLNGLD